MAEMTKRDETKAGWRERQAEYAKARLRTIGPVCAWPVADPSTDWQPISTVPKGDKVRIREGNRVMNHARCSENDHWSSDEGGILMPIYPDSWAPQIDG